MMNDLFYFLPPVLYYALLLSFSGFCPQGTAPLICAAVCLPVFLPLLRRYPAGNAAGTGQGVRLLPAAASFAGGAAYSVLSAAVMQFTGAGARLSSPAQDALFALHPLLQLTGLCLLVPICEELVYRGFLMTGLKKYIPAAAAIQILLFAVGHADPVQILYAIPAGVFLTLLSERAGLQSAILFHVGANLSSVAGRMLMQ